MTFRGNEALQAGAEHERILAMANVAAAIAALECAEDPNEFGRIKRSILTAMQQTFPVVFDFNEEEVD